MNNYVYHGSNVPNIKRLEPKLSTHGEKYVYASPDIVIATIFLARWNDYIFRLNHIDDNLILVENYEGALQEVFNGKKGYVYKLKSTSFYFPENHWQGEVVSKEAVEVEEVIDITNIYETLCQYEKEGKVKLYRYPDRPSIYPADDSDLIELVKLNIKNFGEDQLQKFLEYHPHLENKVK